MERQPHLLDTEKYLARVENSELEPEGSLAESLVRLKVPLHESGYQEEGTIEGSFEDYSFACTYSVPDEDSNNKIQTYLARLVKWEGIASDSASLDVKTWRQLDELVFKDRDGKATNLLTIAPESFQVFFCPTAEKMHGAVNTKDRVVYILGDILTPESISTLMHEVGHLWDVAKLKEHGVERLVTKSWNGRDDNAELIRRERTATAFAIQKMRPFLKGQMKKDITNHLKAYALQSYYARVREAVAFTRVLEKDFQSDADYWTDSLQKQEEDCLWETWWEWRDTPAYLEWKSKDEFKNINAWDEFGLWQEWIKKTGYNFHKDLPEEVVPDLLEQGEDK